jgi:hypothetical protein
VSSLKTSRAIARLRVKHRIGCPDIADVLDAQTWVLEQVGGWGIDLERVFVIEQIEIEPVVRHVVIVIQTDTSSWRPGDASCTPVACVSCNGETFLPRVVVTDLDTEHGGTDANKRDGARQLGRLDLR